MKKSLLILIGLVSLSFAGTTDKQEAVKKYFNSGSEKTTLDSTWTSPTIFAVGVFDNGRDRSGYGSYVCLVMNENRFQGAFGNNKEILISVKNINNFKTLGRYHCKKQ